MTLTTITERDRAMAWEYVQSLVCSHARKTRTGLGFCFVSAN